MSESEDTVRDMSGLPRREAKTALSSHALYTHTRCRANPATAFRDLTPTHTPHRRTHDVVGGGDPWVHGSNVPDIFFFFQTTKMESQRNRRQDRKGLFAYKKKKCSNNNSNMDRAGVFEGETAAPTISLQRRSGAPTGTAMRLGRRKYVTRLLPTSVHLTFPFEASKWREVVLHRGSVLSH